MDGRAFFSMQKAHVIALPAKPPTLSPRTESWSSCFIGGASAPGSTLLEHEEDGYKAAVLREASTFGPTPSLASRQF